MERNGWTSTGAEGEQEALHPSMAPFRRIPERNQAEARLRYLRARRLDSKEDDGKYGVGSLPRMSLRQMGASRLRTRIFSSPFRLNYHFP